MNKKCFSKDKNFLISLNEKLAEVESELQIDNFIVNNDVVIKAIKKISNDFELSTENFSEISDFILENLDTVFKDFEDIVNVNKDSLNIIEVLKSFNTETDLNTLNITETINQDNVANIAKLSLNFIDDLGDLDIAKGMSNLDFTEFNNNVKDSLIRLSFINNLNGNNSLNINSQRFNEAIIQYKNIIVNKLYEHLKNKNKLVESKNPNYTIYKDNSTDTIQYNWLINTSNSYFSQFLDTNGIFNAETEVDKNLFFDYVLLSNFDDIIRNNPDLNTLIKINYFSNIENNASKYNFIFGLQKDADFNDNLEDINSYSNKLVKYFIETIKVNGNNIKFNDFNNMISHLKSLGYFSTSKLNILSDLYGIKEEFKLIANTDIDNNLSLFKKENSLYAPIFKSIYQELFNEQEEGSVFNLSKKLKENEVLVRDNDLYTMILNHINKTTSINYVTTTVEDGEHKIVILENIAIKKIKGDINRTVAANTNKQGVLTNAEKYHIEPIKDANNKIVSFNFKIPLETGKFLDLNTTFKALPELYQGGAMVKEDFKLLLTTHKKAFSQFFKTMLSYNSINDNFIDILINSYGEDVNTLIPTIATLIASNHFYTELSNTDALGAKRRIIEESRSNNFYKESAETVFPISSIIDEDGYIIPHKLITLSHVGFNLIANTIAIVNNETNKSFVTDANQNKLPITRLQNLINNDKTLFIQILLKGDNKTLQNNPFILDQKFNQGSRNLTKWQDTVLQTTFTNHDKEFKNITDMTISELLYNQVYSNYFLSKLDGYFYNQPTTFSDKKTIWLKKINLNTSFSNNQEDILSKKTTQELYDLNQEKLKYFYNTLRTEINNDYKLLFDTLNKLGHQVFINNDITNTQDLETKLGLVSEEMLEDAIFEILKTKKDFVFIDGVHYINSGKGTYIPNTILNKNIEIFNSSDLYKQKLQIEQKLYAGLLADNNVYFSTVYNDGKSNNSLINSIKESFKFGKGVNDINMNAFEEYSTKWINPLTKKLINYKLYKKNLSGISEEIEIGSAEYRNLYNNTTAFNTDYVIELNPELDRFFALDNFISSQYNSATVGLSYNKPFKYKSVIDNLSTWENYKLIESGQVGADHKRAIIFNSTITPLISNLLQGVRDKMKVAIVEDPRSLSVNLLGNYSTVDQYDGSTWLNPLTAILINDSLKEMKLDPYHLKPIGYYNHHKYGSSTLHKTADHTITNDVIRNSMGGIITGEKLMRQMTNIPWERTDINIVKNVIISNMFIGDPKNETFTKIIGVSYKGENMYEIKTQDVDINGNILSGVKIDSSVIINSNYNLWRALGGQYSMKMSKDNTLIYSESSIDKTVEIMNKVSFLKEGVKISNVLNQDYYYQPLKHSNIDKLIFTSSTKHNAFNVNHLKRVFTDNDLLSNSNLIHSEVDNTFMGIQLNAGHELDESTVSEMTQMINAVSQMGLNKHEVNEIHKSIGQIIRNKVNELLLGEESKKDTYDDVTKTLAKNYINQSTDISLASTYLKHIMKLIDSKEVGNLDEYELTTPFDSGNIFKIFTNTVTGKINSEIIKRIYPGLGAVTAPAHDLITVYDGEDGKVYTHAEIILNKLKNKINHNDIEIDLGEVINGDIITYTILKDGTEQTFTKKVVHDISNSLKSITETEKEIQYHYLKSLRRSITKITKNNTLGRNLRTRNTTFKLDNGTLNTFNLFDFDISVLLNNLKSYHTLGKDHWDYLNLTAIYNQAKERLKLKHGLTDENIQLLINNTVLNSDNEKVTLNKDNKNLEFITTYLKGLLQDDLNTLTTDKLFRVPIRYKEANDFETITDFKHSNDEIILGNIYKERFMLKEGDSINDILNNKEFFKDRMEKFYNTDVPSDLYDIYLVSQNGNHLHVSFNDVDLKNPNITPLDIKKIKKADKWYRIDDKGKILYEITTEMKFYSYTNPNNQITREIVVANSEEASKFNERKKFSYSRLNYKEKNIKTIFNYRLLTSWTSDGVLISSLKNDGLDLSNLSNLENYADLTENQLKLYKEYIEIDKKGTPEKIQKLNIEAENKFINFKLQHSSKIFESFRASLNFISARIPTQSMQSFMNTTVVGFVSTDKESNVVYAPLEQMIYQGADYDIDKEYLLGAYIDENGIYTGWSPYFNYTSEQFLKLSNELPLPNREVTLLMSSSINKNTIDLTNSYNQFKLLLSINQIDINDLENVSNLLKNNIDVFESFVNIIKNINFEKASNNVLELYNIDENTFKLIQRHNKFKMASIVLENAIKNKIFYNLIKIGASPKSILVQTVPMDLDIIKNIGNESIKVENTKLFSNENPGIKPYAQDNNLIGSANIGITANFNKLFSNLLIYYHNVLNDENIKIVDGRLNINPLVTKPRETISFNLSGELNQIKLGELITNISVDNLQLKPDVKLLVKAELNNIQNILSEIKRESYESEEEYNKAILMAIRPNDDTFDMLSLLLSGAVDNAKELVLDKINASKELLPIFTTLLIKGMNFRDICRIMSSNEITLLVNKLRENIIFTKKLTINEAIDYYIKGVPSKLFIDKKYIKSLNDFSINFITTNNINTPELLLPTGRNFEELVKYLIKFDKLNYKKFIEGLKDFKLKIGFEEVIQDETEESERELLFEEEDLNFQNDFSFEDWETNEDSELPTNKNHIIYRYLEEAENRQYEINKISTNGDLSNLNYQVISKVNKEATELKALLKFLSFNKGVSVNPDEKLSSLTLVNRNMNSLFLENKTVRPFNIGFKRKYEIDEKKTHNMFDLFRFTTEENYRKDIINLYEHSKQNINILHLISISDTYMEVLKAIKLDSDLISTFSRKFTELNTILLNNPVIKANKQNVNSIIDFLNDSIIIKFLKTSDIDFNLQEGSVLHIKGTPIILGHNYKLDFSKQDDVRSYKNWVENGLRNKLIEAFPNNLFVQNLNKFSFKNNLKVYTSSLKTTIDLVLNKNETSTQINQLIKSFGEIKDQKFDNINNMTIEDALYLYNIIQNKDKISAYSLTNLFKDLNINNKESIGYKYIKFIGKISLNESNLFNFTSNDYHMHDLFINFSSLDSYSKINKTIQREAKKIDITVSYNKETSIPYEIFYEDNILMYPNTWGEAKSEIKSEMNIFTNKLLEYLNSDKLEITLC